MSDDYAKRVVRMIDAVRAHEGLRMGLITSVYFSEAIQEYDPDYEPRDMRPRNGSRLSRESWRGLPGLASSCSWCPY